MAEGCSEGTLKQLTAAALMTLVGDGRLSLDDSVVKYFPEAPGSWKGITVRRLLTHTAGMGDYPEGFDERRDYTEDELLALIKSAPLAYTPGEARDYSNLGYVLSWIRGPGAAGDGALEEDAAAALAGDGGLQALYARGPRRAVPDEGRRDRRGPEFIEPAGRRHLGRDGPPGT